VALSISLLKHSAKIQQIIVTTTVFLAYPHPQPLMPACRPALIAQDFPDPGKFAAATRINEFGPFLMLAHPRSGFTGVEQSTVPLKSAALTAECDYALLTLVGRCASICLSLFQAARAAAGGSQ
jgi:hypothetical protein